uniref:M23 family metallopeptidase n=1 Tax=Ruminococcus bromii TaxID=40518 RepID=UPI003FF05F7A
MGLTGKEFHLKLERKPGRLIKTHHTHLKIVRADAPAFKQRGLLHKIDDLPRRIEGDKPPLITKRINNMRPKSTFGKSAKVSLKAVNKARKFTTSAAWRTALASETVALTAKDLAQNKFEQKLRYNADTIDTGKAVLASVNTVRTLNNIRKTLISHHTQKKEFKGYKLAAKSNKLKYKSAKRKFKTQKKDYKSAVSARKLKLKKVSRSFKRTTVIKGKSSGKFIVIKKKVKITRKVGKRKKLLKKELKLNKKLRQRQTKLQRQQQIKKRNKKPKPKTKPKTSQKVAEIAKKFVGFIFKFFAAVAAPLLIVIFFFTLILMIFGGGASKNSAILGTYYCNDYDMSRAIESYTNIAYEYNSNLIRCKSKNEWRQGLKSLKVNTDSMDDTPTKYYYGKNIIQNYEPVYDFDANKLIAFMCAYTYDFTDANDKEQSWSYDDDKFDDILQDLFDKEYSFKYKYINGSYWQELGSYDAYPGYASDEYYYSKSSGSIIDNGKTYGYIDFGSCGVPSALTSYHKSKKVYFNLSTGEILNVNKSYAKTGYYFQNCNQQVVDSMGGIIPSFYSLIKKNNEKFWGWRGSGTKVYRKTQLTINGQDFNWAISSDDVKTRFGENGKQAVRFYKRDTYITDCSLYTNVKQVRSFDDAIYAVLNSKSQSLYSSQTKIKEDYAQRKQYYQILSCQEKDDDGNTATTYGLHQSFECNPLPGNFDNAQIYNNFGYDVVSWYNRHCQNTMHYGTDFSASKGTNVYSLMDGKVESIDTSNHTVVIITEKDRNIWYENDTARTFKLTYGNITLKSGLKKDSKVKLGEYIGKVDDYKHCDGNDTKANQNYLHLGVQIKYNLVWHDVDPQFLIYRENK